MDRGQNIFTQTGRPEDFRIGMTTIRSHATFLFLLLCFVPLISAQSPVRLTGFVFDQNGAPIAHATVRFVEDPGTRTSHSVSTDDTGLFLFEDVSTRRGRLIVDAAGFRQSSIDLSGADVEMQIVLLPEAVSGSVTVTRTESRIEET